MNKLDLAQPQRQSLVGVAVIFFKNLRIAINIFISILALQFGFKGSFLGLSLWDFAYIVIAVFMLISYLQYRRFFFYVVENKFIIEKGLFSRDRITIPFDRIQSVNLNQNLIQQLLNVMALKVDTAGSSDKELEIAALPKAYARELQKFLIARKEELRLGDEGTEVAQQQSEQPAKAQLDGRGRRPLVQLSIADLLRVGITENHLRTALVVFAVLNGYIWQYEELILKPYEDMIEEQTAVLLRSSLLLIPLVILFFLLLAVLISMVRTALRYFRLEFFVDEKGVHLVSGLLKRAEYQVPVNKIQYLKWKSNPLRRLIGLQTLLVKQASTEQMGDRQSIRVPGVRREQLIVVLDEFYPEQYKGSYRSFRAHRLLFIQRAVWLAVVPAFLIAALGYFSWYWWPVALLYLSFGLVNAYRNWRALVAYCNEEMMVLRKGWLFPSYLSLQYYKLQNLRLSQSIFQKRRGLASLSFHTAAGDERLPHIGAAEARQLYDYLLYKIESDHRSWM